MRFTRCSSEPSLYTKNCMKRYSCTCNRVAFFLVTSDGGWGGCGSFLGKHWQNSGIVQKIHCPSGRYRVNSLAKRRTSGSTCELSSSCNSHIDVAKGLLS